MEMGATLCGPNWAPRCEECPCRAFCRAHQAGNAEKLPVKSPKKNKKQEKRTVFILECDGAYALEKRPDSGLLASLWQFPNVEGTLDVSAAIAQVESWDMGVKDVQRQLERKHIFTHIIWDMRGFYMKIGKKTDNFRWFSPEEITQNTALPTAFRQFWEAREP